MKIRVEEGGHYVNKSTIKERYINGLALLDKVYSDFDSVTIHESFDNFRVVKCMTFHSNGVTLFQKPSFLSKIPKIASLL